MAETVKSESQRRSLSLQWQMLLGFVIGLVLGLIAYSTQRDAAWVDALTTYVTVPIGQIFLRLLFMLVIPLLFSALVVGISEMGEVRSLKRVGLRTLAYTVVVWALTLVFVPVAEMGVLYTVAAVVLGGLFTAQCLRLKADPTPAKALKVFHGSITYVSLLFGVMAIDPLLSW